MYWDLKSIFKNYIKNKNNDFKNKEIKKEFNKFIISLEIKFNIIKSYLLFIYYTKFIKEIIKIQKSNKFSIKSIKKNKLFKDIKTLYKLNIYDKKELIKLKSYDLYVNVETYYLTSIIIDHYKFVQYKHLKDFFKYLFLEFNKYLKPCLIKHEAKFNKNNKNGKVEYSKKIETNSNMQDTINESVIFYNDYLDNETINYIDKINHLKFEYKDINIILPSVKNESLLNNLLGLCNYNIHNLIDNNNLKLCFNKITRISNKNQFNLYYRDNDIISYNIPIYNEINCNTFIKYIIDDNNIIDKNYIENIVTMYNTFEIDEEKNKDYDVLNLYNIITKYYLINYDEEIYFYRNSIIDIDFIIDDKLIKNIKKCKNRYYMIIGYASGFTNNNDLKTKIIKIIGAAHRISIILDTKKKYIYYYDSMESIDTKFYINNVEIENYLEYIIYKYFTDSNPFFKDYKMIKTISDIDTQNYEYNYNKMEKIIYTNPENIKKNRKNKDWAEGYCGLWNILLAFLISINDHLELNDIFNFYKLLILNGNFIFIKKLIRTFAYYIELVITKKSLEGIIINSYNFVSLKQSSLFKSSENITLNNNNSDKYYENLNVSTKKLDYIQYGKYFFNQFTQNLISGYSKLKPSDLEDTKILNNNILFITI